MTHKTFYLALAVPSGPTWHADFALSVVQMCMAMQKHPVKGYQQSGLFIMNKRTSLLPKSRQELVEDAIKQGCTHILFVDSDQTFPAHLVHKLAQHQKKVIGCNVATKVLPSGPTARNKHETWHGGSVVSSLEKDGIEKVWRLGCGVMLLDLSVFKELPKPWFQITWDETHQEFVGEDWFLCQRLEDAGEEIWVDHELSQAVGHVGNYIYTHFDTDPEVKL